MRRLVYILPLLAFLGVASYLASGLTRDPQVLPSALIDKPVPSFSLPPLPGREPAVGLADGDLADGQVQLVNVFASWCAPCRAEQPELLRLSRELKLPINGIAYKDKPEDSLAFLKGLGDPYKRVGVDRDGRAGIEWGVYGVPETYVIDGRGRVRYRHVGPLNPGDVEQFILPAVEAARAGTSKVAIGGTTGG